MVLIQLLLPTATGAHRDHAMAAFAETRRELVDGFRQDTIHVRALPVDMPDDRE
jgi:hypothetical protein